MLRIINDESAIANALPLSSFLFGIGLRRQNKENAFRSLRRLNSIINQDLDILVI